ncbi:MAG TPA: DUF427 domain-containing protein [Candidatus Saccharimonadales bacterium]
MAKAFVITSKGEEIVLAKSDDTIRIEGNYYFPPESVNDEYLTDSQTHTTCHWKGEASYKTVSVGNERWADGAWYYSNPTPSSLDIVKKDYTNYIAFWRGVQVSE